MNEKNIIVTEPLLFDLYPKNTINEFILPLSSMEKNKNFSENTNIEIIFKEPISLENNISKISELQNVNFSEKTNLAEKNKSKGNNFYKTKN